MTALAVKTATASAGTTSVSDLVNVMDFLQAQILPELQSDANTMPVLKADAIKFVTTFRNQIPRAGYGVVLPLLVNMLTSKNYVVHSYAANAIERMLIAREQGQPKVTAAELAPLLPQLCANLFALLDRQESKENVFVMKGA